eukprot:CAMPEP_0174250746 /NCGR_PEP_ID=MMETSP0439-20130205/820_1 /TAXON_ID=0 /ORGANISM="Stereomyxa ramosa, Strain Chinc5" /LENGTH=265 /DNA_ID=CAMNT_0015330893 /DNA_START=52 /DNA_END=852 /DNA_ORIENTATION=+
MNASKWVSVVSIVVGIGLSYGGDIVVFGDSWGTMGASSFEKMAHSHNLTVFNIAVGGTTAAGWAKIPNYLPDQIRAHSPDARYVWLTIGGNDAIPAMLEHIPISTIVADVLNNTKIFLTPLFKAYPNIKVVQFGYDILFWDYFLCGALAKQIFWSCDNLTGSDYIACSNKLFFSLQFDYVQALDSVYPGQHFTVNLLGSLQAAGNVPNATVGNPNINYFSPHQYTGLADACIHANDAGYDVIFASLWDLFFAKHEQLSSDLNLAL